MLPGRVVDSFLLGEQLASPTPQRFGPGVPPGGFAHPYYSHHIESSKLDLWSLAYTDL